MHVLLVLVLGVLAYTRRGPAKQQASDDIRFLLCVVLPLAVLGFIALALAARSGQQPLTALEGSTTA